MQERKAAQAVFVIIFIGMILTACRQETSTIAETITLEVEEGDTPANIDLDPEVAPVTLNLYTTNIDPLIRKPVKRSWP